MYVCYTVREQTSHRNPYFKFSHITLKNFLFFCLQWQCSACKTNSVQFLWMIYCKHICICMQRQWQSVMISTWPTAITNSFGFRNVNTSKKSRLQPKRHLFAVKVLTFMAKIKKNQNRKPVLIFVLFSLYKILCNTEMCLAMKKTLIFLAFLMATVDVWFCP